MKRPLCCPATLTPAQPKPNHSPQSTRRLLKRIRGSQETRIPTLVGMEFVRYVRNPSTVLDKFDADFAWSVYISHDPCHDEGKGWWGRGFVDDRNTVLAIHRMNGTFRVIGRELDRKFALRLAKGLI